MEVYKSIKLSIFDFDGVFSDKIYISSDNKIIKSYNSKDSYALKLLQDNNIKIGIVTAGDSNVINNMEKIISRVDYISVNNYNKIDKIKEWCKELNITLDNCSYIGDDLFDSDFMDQIGFTGCPSDAIKECKDKAKYTCTNKGGDGAVREFVEKILEYNKYNEYLHSEEHINMRKNGKITAIIPVRSGSTRCKNKNIRQFGDTNLLKKKIELLKQIDEIDEIIVSSNCDQMLQIAKELDVKIDKRPEYYSKTETTGSELFYYLSTICQTDILLYIHAVCPFVSIENIKKTIDLYRTNLKYDSIISSKKINHFLWSKTKPINYDPFKAIPSQELPDYFTPTFSPIIIDNSFVMKNKSIIGYKPFFYILSEIESIDIDTHYDFTISELLYKNGFENNDDIINYLNWKEDETIELLDCTIRDGGYINNWNFTDEEVLDCYKAVSESGYNYFEIGFRTNKDLLSNKGKWCYSCDNDIDNICNKYKGCKISVMVKIGTFNIEDFQDRKYTNIDLVRILLPRLGNRYNNDELIKSKNIIKNIIKLGYEICINLACGDKLFDDEIKDIVDIFIDLPLKCIYLADTYGGFDEDNLVIIINKFYKEMKKHNKIIKLGFHGHDNNQNSVSKTKVAIDRGCLMIDSCINGLGRGAGNLKTELIILELNKKFSKNYNLLPILEYSDKYILKNDEYKNKNFIYGYHILYALSGYLSIHPDYINDLINDTELSLKDKYNKCFMIKEYCFKNNNYNYIKHLYINL
jgi:YrbI family 3-deoxy-D-manno-octulosonate 8-phosphate phosphatase